MWCIHPRVGFLVLVPILMIGGYAETAIGAADSPATLELFEKKIRPLLVEVCHECHSAALGKGGLNLDSRAAMLRGGESGPAVVVGKPEESLLISAVNHEDGLKMPPKGKLTSNQIAALVAWIKAGAEWPEEAAVGPLPLAKLNQATATPPDQGSLAKDLELWLHAEPLTLNDGDPVHVWPDRSGHGRDVSATKGVRANGIGLPGKFVKQSTLLKRPAVRYEPATGLASSPNLAPDIEGDAALSIIVVMNLKQNDAKESASGIFGLGDVANPSVDPGRPLAAVVQIHRGEENALQLAGGWNHDASLGKGSFKPFFGKTIILTVTKQPGPMRSTTRFFINGEPAGASGEPLEGRDTVPNIRRRSDVGVFLGKVASWAGSIQGDIGEILLYKKALGDEERRGIEAYLADQFGMILGPPSNFARHVTFSPEEKGFWAYQPVSDPAPPAVKDEAWVMTPVDRFILNKLESLGVPPAVAADKITLVRRMTFDLTGLPPSPEEVDAFLADGSPNAMEKVVDRLLASPHYGERWARHWLDAVRFAESTANDANAVMRYAWRYRNYVIDAFNHDLPYNEFLVEQLAGDLLPTTASVETNTRRLVATGFLMIGPKALAETDKEQSRLDIVDDQIDVTGRALLGLTVACARCHDHKFDAIRTTDYYALAGIFRSTEPFQNEVRNATMWWEFPVPQGPDKAPVIVMAPKEGMPRHLRVHLRGNRFTLGATVPRGMIAIVNDPNFSAAATSENSGRLELARWIANARNPLASRVMVNRIWQHHFGRGLVGTSDNFGTRGDRPSHPELLDWLAARFVESGWSMKAIHRIILLSNTYQLSGQTSPDARRADPTRIWLSSFPRRRLSAEELRDTILAVSGSLDRVPGTNESGEYLVSKAENIGAMIMPNRLAADDPIYTTFRKRSIYLPVVRNMLPDVFALFDAADSNSVTAVRNETTVPSQSLFMLNSALVREQSSRFSQRLLSDASKSDEERIEYAHRLAFGRPATRGEVAEAKGFLAGYAASHAARSLPETERRLAAWRSYCQCLLCENAFIYID